MRNTHNRAPMVVFSTPDHWTPIDAARTVRGCTERSAYVYEEDFTPFILHRSLGRSRAFIVRQADLPEQGLFNIDAIQNLQDIFSCRILISDMGECKHRGEWSGYWTRSLQEPEDSPLYFSRDVGPVCYYYQMTGAKT